MRHTAVITKVLIGMLTVLGTLPAAAGEPTTEKRYRDEDKFKKRFELERAADQASHANQLARAKEIVHIVPNEPDLSRYLNSGAGLSPELSEDKGLTVRQAMERRLARFEAALEEARRYRKDLPMNPPEGVTERVALEGRIDSKINYEAFKKATLRAIAEYDAFDHYKTGVQVTFRKLFGDLYRVPGETRMMLSDSSQSMDAFFNKYRTGFVMGGEGSDPEKLFREISGIENRLKKNSHGGSSKMSTVLYQQLNTLQSAEKNGVRVYAGNMHVPVSADALAEQKGALKAKQQIGLQFQSALSKAKELRAKTGGSGPMVVFVTAATVFSGTAAAGEAEPVTPEVSGEVAAEFSRSWARPQAQRTSR